MCILAELPGFGTLDAQFAYELIGFGALDAQFAHEFIEFRVLFIIHAQATRKRAMQTSHQAHFKEQCQYKAHARAQLRQVGRLCNMLLAIQFSWYRFATSMQL